MRSIEPQACDEPPPGWEGSHEDKLVTLIMEATAMLRRGEPVDIRNYPGFEEDLAKLLPIVEILLDYAKSLKDDSEEPESGDDCLQV